MATCKSCLHFGVCKFKDLPAPLSDSYIRESECIEKRCGDFKDRSRFVELPCKYGDYIYQVLPNKKVIIEYIVIWVQIEETGIFFRVVDTHYFTTSIVFAKDIGTKAFLTKEEAEQALKERENNGDL